MGFLPALLLALGLGCAPAMEIAALKPTGVPARAAASIIRIGILPKTARVTLRPQGRFTVVDRKTGESRALESGREYAVAGGDADGFELGPYRFAGSARLSSEDPQARIGVDDKTYRGSLVIRPNPDATVTVVDELGLEEYLYGVLPAEMSPDWPLEALKAQAVVARTFALNNFGKYESSGFDLSSDARSQAYADVAKESPRVRDAVRETEGQVLSWRGRLLKAYYHSCCGGHTAAYGDVWGGGASPRPLRGVPDRFCRASPEFEWTAYFAEQDILAALQRHGRDVTRIRRIAVQRADLAGFARTLRFHAREKAFDVPADDFRKWMGGSELKSVKILRIVARRKGFEFRGRGYGHGVGLCQWGANLMAKHNEDYRQILEHYFPGAKLARYDE